MNDLNLLRTVGLKGRVEAAAVAESLGVAAADVEAKAATLQADGLLATANNGALRLTPEGRERLAELLASERGEIDQAALAAIYEDFCEINARAKQVFTSWQVRPDGQPNDHTDATYDAAVLEELTRIHEEVLPVVERTTAHVPRAARFAERLVEAQRRYSAGEQAYVTRPIIDSYHTVWFELHEDLISWCGLTREAEAAAGRAH